MLLIPPLLIWLLYNQTGVVNSQQTAAQVLFPRFDESTPEYYTNLESMQYAFIFFIRLYDNFAYHLQHIHLNATTYKVLFACSVCISIIFAYMGKWLVMIAGLMVLLNKTWFGTFIETILQFLMEVVQTAVDIFQKFRSSKKTAQERKPIQVSVYENQRWWAGTGYTSQVRTIKQQEWLASVAHVYIYHSLVATIGEISLVQHYRLGTSAIKGRNALTSALRLG